MREFLQDEDAQATTEYVLVLAVIVSIAIILVRDLIKPILGAFTENLSESIEKGMFNPDAMHRSPFRPQ